MDNLLKQSLEYISELCKMVNDLKNKADLYEHLWSESLKNQKPEEQDKEETND